MALIAAWGKALPDCREAPSLSSIPVTAGLVGRVSDSPVQGPQSASLRWGEAVIVERPPCALTSGEIRVKFSNTDSGV